MSRIALLFSLCLLATPAAAQRSLAIERFDAAIVVGRDGSVDVTETITAKFTGSWNGIYRTVPVEYHTPRASTGRCGWSCSERPGRTASR